jgi:hypothetical protein
MAESPADSSVEVKPVVVGGFGECPRSPKDRAGAATTFAKLLADLIRRRTLTGQGDDWKRSSPEFADGLTVEVKSKRCGSTKTCLPSSRSAYRCARPLFAAAQR